MLRTLICHGIILQLHNINGIINPFVPNAPFLHAQKETSSGVEKGCIGNKWVKLDRKLFALNYHFKLMKQYLQVFCTKSILKSVGNLLGKNLWPCAFLSCKLSSKYYFITDSRPRLIQIVFRKLLDCCL